MRKHSHFGFSLIELCIVVTVLGVLAAIAIPNYFSTRRAANETAAISSLRMVSSSQKIFESTVGKGDFGDISQLVGAAILDSSFSDGIRSGYDFRMNRKTRAENNGQGIYNAQALPIVFGRNLNGTGSRYFYTNELSVIYQSDTEGAIPFAVSDTDRTITNGAPVAQ